MKVQLLFDVELNEKGEILTAGSTFDVAKTWKNYQGYTPIMVNGIMEYFKTSCFKFID